MKGCIKHLANTWCAGCDHLTRVNGWGRILLLRISFFSPWQWTVVKAAVLYWVICWAFSPDTSADEAALNPHRCPENDLFIYFCLCWAFLKRTAGASYTSTSTWQKSNLCHVKKQNTHTYKNHLWVMDEWIVMHPFLDVCNHTVPHSNATFN